MKYKDFFINEDSQLKGGVGDATAPSTVDPAQLALGVQIEMEHTNNEKIATEIALDHLTEDGQYYQKLIAAGLAKEFQPQANSGFGDPKQSFNDPARLGNTVTCTPGNNRVGSMGNTPIGKVKDSEPVGPTGNTVDLDIEEPTLDEAKKKKKKNDRCIRIAKSKYKKWPSAYASGAVVKCRQGKIWKKKQEESVELEEKKDFRKEKEQGLHGWFARRGGKGKSKGWVDCNTCRKDKETGRKTCKSCGRQAGEKRSKYPACRPTPSQCNKKGTSSKKGPSSVSWQKKNESVEPQNPIKLTDIVNDILKQNDKIS